MDLASSRGSLRLAVSFLMLLRLVDQLAISAIEITGRKRMNRNINDRNRPSVP